MTVTLRFEVPDSAREIFGHELDLLLDQMEPLIAWLHRNGGRLELPAGITR